MAALTLINVAILIAAGLVVLAALTSLLSLRLGVPLLLVFLCLGLLAGEDGLGQIDFDNAPIAFFVGSVALAIILFDAGFETPWRSFRLAAGPGLTLATIGVVLTAVAVAAIARLLMPLDWPSALMLGAIVSSTDAAAVILLLRLGGIAVRDRVRSTLEIESGSNDPIAIFLTVGLAEVASHPGHASLLSLLPSFLLELGIGALGGALGGWAILRLVNRVHLEEGLYPLVVLGSALAIFGGLNALHASGFLGVYVAGLVAGNGQLRGAAGIRRFQSGLTWLSQIGMFLTLGLLATPSDFGAVILPALAIGATLIFLARPLAVWLCLLPFGFGRRETAFVGWVGLRGAVSILLAIIPLLSGNPFGQAIFNTAFLVVLMSLLIQGWSLKPVAARLGQIVPLRQGALERVELALPGEQKMELLAYSVVAGSPVAEGQALPRWARPSLVLRDGNELPPGSEGALKADDHVFIFAPPERVSLLDRLFAERVKLTGEESEFFGDFPVPAETPLARLAAQYDLILPQQKGGLSLSELFAERFGEVEVGDRLRIGAIELVVTELDAGRAKVVGLVLAPAHQPSGLPSLPTGREMAVLLKRRWRHRRQRGRKAARREPTIAPSDRQE